MDGEHQEMMNYRGAPVDTSNISFGGWKAALFVAGVTGCAYFAYGGVSVNLVLYLMQEWGEEPASAANDVTNFVGATFLTPIVGGVFGDAYLGKIWTVVLFLAIYSVGNIMLAAIATIQIGSRAFLMASLYMVAVGSGSYEPVITSLGGDQFNSDQDKELFFSMLFVACSIGNLLAFTVLAHIMDNEKWALGFWVSSGLVVLSAVLFLSGSHRYRQFKLARNPILRLAQVFVCAARKWRVRFPARVSDLHERSFEELSISPSRHQKLAHTNQFRCLDRAAVISHADEVSNPWHTCTVTQVEEAKCVIRIIPFFIVGIMFNATIAQVNTLFVEQCEIMERHISRHFKVPSASMSVFTCIASIMFAPLYTHVILQYLRNGKRLTTLQRMGVGIFTTMLAMMVAATVENWRLKEVQKPHSDQMSILWLAPQYMIVGIAAFFTIVAQLDFFYTEVPRGMKSVGSCICLLTKGIGNYVSTILVTVVTRISTRGGKRGWIPSSLNEGHIAYFYWMLALIMLLTLFFHILASKHYTHLH